MEPTYLTGLIGLAILIALSTSITAMYAALVGARRPLLKEEAEQGNQRAALAYNLAEDSLKVLSTFQLANLLNHFLIAGLLAVLLIGPVDGWLRGWIRSETVSAALSFIVVVGPSALLVFVLTELVPNILVQRDTTGWAIALAEPASLLTWMLSPVVSMMGGLRYLLAMPLGGEAETLTVTAEEIMTLVDAGEEDGSIEREEKDMIYSVFRLDDTLAREIMVPRIDMIALDINTPLQEARELIIQEGHSRIPIYQDTLDHIKGLLYAKDLIELWHLGEKTLDLSSKLRPALFVPETKRVSDLLKELQTKKVHMAIVIDEYGGTAGLVTIEDIVEEIFGEIFDEYDEPEEALYEPVGNGVFMVDARIDLDDLERLLDIDLPDDHGEDTLGGFIYASLGKVPDEGETIDTERIHLQVMNVVDRRIRKVLIKRLATAQPLDVNEAGKALTASDKQERPATGNRT